MKIKTLFLVTGFILTIFACEKNDRIPSITTSPVSNIDVNTATCGGNITSDEGSPINERGICWSTNSNPTISDSKTNDGYGTGAFISTLTALQPNTNYYVRAYATNDVGTGYGAAVSFVTLDGVLDIDGNGYHIVKIGNQSWLKENLKTTKYRDGTPIAGPVFYPTDQYLDDFTWYTSTSGAFCWHYYGTSNDDSYGALYNWYAVSECNLCPEGWHVPTDEEWTQLIEYVAADGHEGTEGTALKAENRWLYGYSGTDDYGFTALPAGRRAGGGYGGVDRKGYWWSSTEDGENDGWYRAMDDGYKYVYRGSIEKWNGFSVRCLRD
ncbi:MAG: fibrobacter succinogenes major paralogous domain-containing protein [Bacteroidales bacterium]|nr:fibrobacter succinogenes major paralogous domain-containing protein [Bacteroidales bacterium]